MEGNVISKNIKTEEQTLCSIQITIRVHLCLGHEESGVLHLEMYVSTKSPEIKEYCMKF